MYLFAKFSKGKRLIVFFDEILIINLMHYYGKLVCNGSLILIYFLLQPNKCQKFDFRMKYVRLGTITTDLNLK